MKQKELKNTVVLKNLQSNLIEEAIIVFKKNTKIPKGIKLEGNESIKEYPLVEAEKLVNNYAIGIKQTVNKKIKRHRMYIGISICVIIIQNILIYFK